MNVVCARRDARIVYKKSERVCALTCGQDFMVPLASHPASHQGQFRPIMTADVAGHVLTRVEPDMRDPSIDVHTAMGYSSDGTEPIMYVIWFRASISKPVADVANVLARLRSTASAVAHTAAARASGGGNESKATQGANGVYYESGIGVMAGSGRRSVDVAGTARNIPFLQQTSPGSEHEDLLAELLCGLAYVVSSVAPELVSHSHDTLLERGHQYPRQAFEGAPFVKSHQAALRASGGEGDPQGSDLHVDPMDGKGNLMGGWTIYAGEPPSSFDHLAIFEGSGGGCGFQVRVGGFGSEWVCGVNTDTAQRLHGSVWSTSPAAAADTCVGQGLRIVSYPLRRIELLEEAVRRSPHEEAKVHASSTPTIQQRMLGLWGQRSEYDFK